MLVVEGYCEATLLRYLSNRLFASSEFRKYIGYERQLFVENVQNLMQMSKLKKKIQKKSFSLEIIAYEIVVLNCLC